MSKFDLTEFNHSYPRWSGFLTTTGAFMLATVIVLFAWNSFAVPMLDADALRFREALGLTLLVAVTGRLLTPARRREQRHQQTDRQ